jgi:hypothetical protein
LCSFDLLWGRRPQNKIKIIKENRTYFNNPKFSINFASGGQGTLLKNRPLDPRKTFALNQTVVPIPGLRAKWAEAAPFPGDLTELIVFYIISTAFEYFSIAF